MVPIAQITKTLLSISGTMTFSINPPQPKIIFLVIRFSFVIWVLSSSFIFNFYGQHILYAIYPCYAVRASLMLMVFCIVFCIPAFASKSFCMRSSSAVSQHVHVFWHVFGSVVNLALTLFPLWAHSWLVLLSFTRYELICILQ